MRGFSPLLTTKQCRGAIVFRKKYSTRIKPHNYNEAVSYHKLRESLNDTTYLPQSGRQLLSNDPLCINFKTLNLHKRRYLDPRLESLIEILGQKLPKQAWARFNSLYAENPRILSGLTRVQYCTLMNLIALAPTRHDVTFERVRIIAEAIVEGGHQLGAQEYSRLIKASFKARRYDLVEQLWKDLNDAKIEKTTNLWNAYISATCSGDPSIWTEYNINKSHPEPPITNDPIDLFKQLCNEGHVPNAETYELLVLGFAKQDDMSGVRAVASSIWGRLGDDPHNSKQYHLARYGSMIQPTVSTLTILIHAYGINGATVEGLEYADWLQRKYSINLSTDAASRFWTTALKWTFRTTKPGETPKQTFGALWQSLRNTYQVRPTQYMLYLRLLHLRANKRPNKMVTEMEHIEQMTHLRYPNEILAVYLNETCKLYCRLGYYKHAKKLLDKWAHKHPKLDRVRRYRLNWMETSSVPTRGYAKRQYKRSRPAIIG